jgi:hypothetical protein
MAESIGKATDRLRDPLESIRDSIQAVRGGDLGAVSSRQRESLATAIANCDDLDRLIGELLAADQANRQGTDPRTAQVAAQPLRVQRRRVAVVELRNTIERHLSRDALDRGIDVLWDGADDPALFVFADAGLLSQLMVQLIQQAMRVTVAGGCVLIRLQWQPESDVVQWSVIDQGPGIRGSEIKTLLSSGRDQADAFSLATCQRIAICHFSSLDIYSRIGNGTEIGFTTPRCGPRNVAAVWSQWRVAQTLGAPSVRDNVRLAGQGESAQLRVDPSPARMSLPVELEQQTREADQCSAATVNLGATVARTAADAFDRFLHRQTQPFELTYRVGTRCWACVLDDHPAAAAQRIKSLSATAIRTIPGLRMDWTAPQMVPIEPHTTHVRLSELLVRQTLLESKSTGIVDKDTVRMGTAPMELTRSTSDRLDEELRRLAGQLRKQTDRLQRQSQSLRRG